ncbi:MAG: hypothetical protein M1118_08085, partial [Chloroflexi bacterium]|nr:hypothetical protein [Chloroflexota bacterium]
KSLTVRLAQMPNGPYAPATAAAATAASQPVAPWSQRGWGPGGAFPGGYGPGGMMGRSGYGGYGPGAMMRGWSNPAAARQITSLAQAQQVAQDFVDSLGNKNLDLDEIMEFQNNYYAIVKENSTSIGAFEILINRSSGAVMPEPGPNMMWNTKYGMMSSPSPMGTAMGYQQPGGPVTVTPTQAKTLGQQWLDVHQPGTTTESPDQFYGYYTLHILKDGQVTGMLSVNGYTGQVWFHTWHGSFIQMKQIAS